MGPRRWKRGLRYAVPGGLVLVAFVLSSLTERLDAYAASPFPVRPPLRFDDTRGRGTPAGHGLEVAMIPVEYTLGRGETLGGIFSRLGLSPAEAQVAVEALSGHLNVRRLKAGETYLARFDTDSRLTGLEWVLGDRGRVHLEREDHAWRASFQAFERRVEVRSVAGELEDSLIGSLERAGASAVLAYKMADVLQWDLDFHRDLRPGDRFEVLFEHIHLDGEDTGPGEILALHYDNAGRRLEAYRFGDEDSYYDGEGRPLRKMFLRSPMRFSRVTSRFSHRRFHPILKTYRPHYGVDYGAPVGTPVRVTAGGMVTFAGRDGGSGRMIKVRHPNGYLTAYLHLSGFARGIRRGVRVQQGQVIGFVGSTGLATAPHLDYRVQQHGRWIDPLSIKTVPAEPVPEAARREFEIWRDALRARLELGVPLPSPPETREPTRVAGVKPALTSTATAGR